MSYQDGWAAINLEMPQRIPRTEYSASEHWELVGAVTGTVVGADSPPEVKERAAVAFMRAWDYSLFWNTLIYNEVYGDLRTDMGHGVYASGGGDRRDTVSCPFKDPEEALRLDPWEAYGAPDKGALVRRFEEHYAAACRRCDFGVNMTGIYVTLISGLIEIFGWEMLLLAAGTDPRRFGELANRYAAWMQPYFDALAEADVPVVMVHDDMVWSSGPFIRPAWYREVVFPNYGRYFAPLRESGKKILFTCDGNYTAFLDDVAQAGVHGFVLEPLTSLEAVVERYGQSHVIIGNADTRILLTGSREQIRAEVERCIRLGRDCPGYFLAVGNHIPANTPIESALYYNQVYEELSRR